MKKNTSVAEKGKEKNNSAIAGVQPSVLRWARTTIGLSVEEAARRLGKPAEKIESWENGEEMPTYPQLEKLAYEVYKRPTALFFLPAPPDEPTPAGEFRTLPGEDLHELAPDTYMQIRRARAYQASLAELFESGNPAERQIWRDIKLSMSLAPESQAGAVRGYLGISLDEQKKSKSADDALKIWRNAVEAVGVFVFKESFDQKTISGFCLKHEKFPIIYLNNRNTKARQIFSLAHELAHLLMGESSLSKLESIQSHGSPTHDRTEQFCNKIAAEVLLPDDDFREVAAEYLAERDEIDGIAVEHLANLYSVSREMILRRLLSMNRINIDYYNKISKLYNAAAQNKQTRSGGSYYATKNVYLSDRYKSAVLKSYYSQRISMEEAADYLGVKPRSFHNLEEAILQGAIM